MWIHTLRSAAILVLLLAGALTRAAGEWPEDSVHHLQIELQTAEGERTRLPATAGHVRIATMFYASCPMACPLIIDALRSIERKLDARERDALRILMVSLDPERDTPEALAELAAGRGIQSARWTLARASEPDTRALAATLGIRYRKLEDGNFDHSSVLVLLDAEGRVLARSNALRVDPAFLPAVRTALGR